jgi:hypothetical protein
MVGISSSFRPPHLRKEADMAIVLDDSQTSEAIDQIRAHNDLIQNLPKWFVALTEFEK